MLCKIQWYGKPLQDEPDISEEVALSVTAVRKDGTIQISFPDNDGETYIDFSLRDLIEQVLRLVGNDE